MLSLAFSTIKSLFYNPTRHAKSLPFLSIGDETRILPSCRFVFRLGEDRHRGKIRIGGRAMIGGEFVFESDRGDVEVGDRSFINRGTRIICRHQISIGADVTLAWGCTLYDHNSHSLAWQDRAADIHQQLLDVQAGRNFIENKNWSTVTSRPIVIEDKAWVGFGVTILNGVTVGEGAIIGAGSVVRDDVPPWTIAFGNPAVVVKTVRK